VVKHFLLWVKLWDFLCQTLKLLSKAFMKKAILRTSPKFSISNGEGIEIIMKCFLESDQTFAEEISKTPSLCCIWMEC
jgi:hypothetical protein